MLAKPIPVVPADRRASAFRRFPPGCGRRRHSAATTRQPHGDPLPITSSAAATKPPLANPSVARAAATATKPPLPPNPSIARAAHKAAPPRPRRATPAAVSSGTGTEGPGRGVGSGRKAAAAVNVRRPVSAVRRYPPGCGRGVAVTKRPAPVGEAGAGEPAEMVRKGEPKARACDREEMLGASALHREEFNPNVEVLNEGDGGDAGAQEEGGEKPWVVNGLMAVSFMPWAQHGRRKSQRPNA